MTALLLLALLSLIYLTFIPNAKSTCLHGDGELGFHGGDLMDHYIAADILLRNETEALLSQCTFGRTHYDLNQHTCFGHCLLRGHCIAVNMTDDGCRLCDYDIYATGVMPDATFNRTYLVIEQLLGMYIFLSIILTIIKQENC